MKIDRDLMDRIDTESDKSVEVVLICRASVPPKDADLAKHRFKTVDRQSLDDLLLIHGEVRLRELKELATIAEVESISSAPVGEIS